MDRVNVNNMKKGNFDKGSGNVCVRREAGVVKGCGLRVNRPDFGGPMSSYCICGSDAIINYY